MQGISARSDEMQIRRHRYSIAQYAISSTPMPTDTAIRHCLRHNTASFLNISMPFSPAADSFFCLAATQIVAYRIPPDMDGSEAPPMRRRHARMPTADAPARCHSLRRHHKIPPSQTRPALAFAVRDKDSTRHCARRAEIDYDMVSRHVSRQPNGEMRFFDAPCRQPTP